MRLVVISLLILTASYKIRCCSVNKIPATHCDYRIQCINNLNHINLEKECGGSSNYDVTIALTLHNATDSFQTESDPSILQAITTLTVFGNWPQTKLSFLEHMYRLKNLNVIYSNIQIVEDNPLNHLFNLESVDFSHNGLTDVGEVFVFEKRPFKLHKISLSYNAIVEIPGYTFEDVTSLIELDLSHNMIENLNDKPFTNLTNLEILKLDHNRIKNLQGAMNELFNLKHLYLRYNELNNIDLESLKTINHLKTFDISVNHLEELNDAIFLRHWEHFNGYFICKINLSKNRLTYIPNAMILDAGHETHTKKSVATELDLSGNTITDIDFNAFQSIEHLISLDVSDNKLMTFDVNPENLSSVKYLNLSCNFLRTLQYRSFSLMRNLENLDVSHNLLEYFPDQSLINTHQLRHINVTMNDIVDLHNLRITFHPAGGVLDMSNNSLSVLRIPVNEAVGLTELILKSNNITDAYLIQLKDAPNLVRLDMSRNIISDLDESSLQLPETLVYIDLNFNEIQRIGPSSFYRVPNLKTLRLSHNRIQNLQYGSFSGLSNLLNLDLSHNQIGYLDSKLLMDLKFLTILSLRYNNMHSLNDDSWIHHKQELKIYLDGNDLSCNWLAKTLNNYNNGYSKVQPKVLQPVVEGNSIEGIPCTQEVENTEIDQKYVIDERLLKAVQKILEAVQNQTLYLKKINWLSILQNARNNMASNANEP
ncbi:toll-like receptor 6 [Danaus plexippus]|uniref:toll-like receptor 6 n=1 Tax=Danaus plexippus TaxID=13037 RepID=UPI002AB043F3|nr:toll-like receptor 6 [Danaus plexippus]